jgi:hypothetical protein
MLYVECECECVCCMFKVCGVYWVWVRDEEWKKVFR